MASAQRLARWKRTPKKGRPIHKFAIIGCMPFVLAAFALQALPAQAAVNTQSPPDLHLMWATQTAMRLGWSASPGATSYTYQLYQMNGVQVRSGSVPGIYHTVICGDLHPGWKYQAEVWDNAGTPLPGEYATMFVTLPAANPPRELAYQWAETQAGEPYLWGGEGDGGYDCSGLVQTAYSHAGIWLPRTTFEMLQYWRLDREAAPRQGDLVFFGDGHVELYAGPGQSFGAETNRTGTWWNKWWPGSWWPTAYYRVTGAG